MKYEEKLFDIPLLDEYFLCNVGTCMEQCPTLFVSFKENINEEKLRESLTKVLDRYPYINSKVIYNKKDKKYYFSKNDKEVKIIKSNLSDRPKEFGKDTNDYPWQLSFYKNKLNLEWSHVICDAKVMYAFLSDILYAYFDKELVDRNFNDSPFLESSYDFNEKGLGDKDNPKGYKEGVIPYSKNNGNKTRCFLLKSKTKDIIALSKRNDASPATIIPPLFSKALRKSISINENTNNKKIKNKNVACSVVINARNILESNSMHNFILDKRITYIDAFDKMSFEKVSTIYRTILELACNRENIVYNVTKNYKLLNTLLKVRPLSLRKLIFKVAAKVMKHDDANFEFSYIGKDELIDEVKENIEYIDFRAWPDYGEANLTALDYNGDFRLNICMNYKDDKVIKDFITESKNEGIEWELIYDFEFVQGNYKM